MRRRLLSLTSLLLLAGCGPNRADSATDPETETTASTETTAPTSGASDGETEGQLVCAPPDPAVDAAFSLELADWPDATDDDHFLDEACTIDAVAAMADTVVTELTCDHDGVLLAATLRVAVSPAGAVTWMPGEGVQIEAARIALLDYGEAIRYVRMRGAGDTLHLVGLENGDPDAERYAPFVVDAAFPCGEEDSFGGGEELRFRLDIGLGDASVGVLDGNRGVLPIDAQHVYAIDVGEATSNHCCHYTRNHAVLIRRVATP
jgi:hypothetical protein